MSRLRRDGLPFEVTPATTRSRSISRSSNTNSSSNNSARNAARVARSRRANILARRRASNSNLQIVHQHFSNLRAPRPQNINPSGPSPVGVSESSPLGVSPFNSLQQDTETHVFKNPDLYHVDNFECNFCGAHLFKEEKTNCCMKGEYAVEGLTDIPDFLLNIFQSADFRTNQRKYNSLFSFTALAAGGMEKRTWTNPPFNSMLTMHGRCYFRAFDCNEPYPNMTVRNSSRMYIYDAYFNSHTNSLRVNPQTAASLRTYVHDNIPWARQYRSAVDEVLNSDEVASGPAFIEFAEVSRVNDGPVVGQPVASNEIAALLYNHGDRCSSTQPIITYPKDSPATLPRFLPQWSSAIEPLQFPMLFCHGESGWSKGHISEEPSFASKTMNISNSKHVPFLFYCRQRLLCEKVFKYNSRIAQEWACSMYSRFEENTLSFAESTQMQNRVALFRSVRQSGSEAPGKLLPASFHGSPAKKKKDTEDALLAIVNRRGRPHIMITMTCNPEWPEIVNNLLPGQVATDNPTLCCQVFKVKMGILLNEIKSGRRVFGKYNWHVGTVEFQKRGLPHVHLVVAFESGPKTPQEMESWVWAQLPSENLAEGRLREYVLKFHVH